MKTVAEFARENNLSAERVRQLCKQKVLSDVTKLDSGRYGTWLIGDECVLPESVLGRPKKNRLGGKLPLIKAAFSKMLPLGSRVWIFGSILDPKKRGGDLDVFVETAKPDIRIRGRLRHAISEIMDGKKVDIVMTAFDDAQACFIKSVACKGLSVL